MRPIERNNEGWRQLKLLLVGFTPEVIAPYIDEGGQTLAVGR